MWFMDIDDDIDKGYPSKLRYVKKFGKGELKVIHQTMVIDLPNRNTFNEDEFIL